ncbi:hypothetical protein TPHA_0B00130 [Tetrapisispora phaffii CBS 4417]|uniref:Uncharacterized protein n=1 Tax=Tetrapisispora phaffii (strain ATCC 24235 / CBS 4417 / NBRC 1672 / NRRL Y-8282 / UCD 70-5) TaxID=1071381 RepID=G8BQ88_TETPH|nr:hypothetical protein TPHA_0B00130 [Tetrapisispora phaffii CBS 4417]CCE61685.1 hypothetical protein TPHA_0B00130 [Tetrapisispora phaffii CBS 4417]
MCFSATHKDEWYADVRIKRWKENNYYIKPSWDIPCQNFVLVPSI